MEKKVHEISENVLIAYNTGKVKHWQKMDKLFATRTGSLQT